MDHSFDVSMASNDWGDVSAIQHQPALQSANTTSVMTETNVAESTRIQQLRKPIEDDVYMASFSQESRGFRYLFSFGENSKDKQVLVFAK